MKKYCCTLIAILCFSFVAHGQRHKDEFFFDEISFSANRTNVSNDNTKDRYGFGVGLYRVALQENLVNVVFGLEYNNTNQLKKITREGHFNHGSNVTYTIRNLSVPLVLRLNARDNARLFLEAGGYIDILTGSQRRGTLHEDTPSPGTTSPLRDGGSVNRSDYGFTFGIGTVVPVGSTKIFFKPFYRKGFKELHSYEASVFKNYLGISAGIRIVK